MMTSREYLDHISAGVVIVDGAGRITVFNRSAAAITGIAAKQILGRSWTQLVASCPWMESESESDTRPGSPSDLASESENRTAGAGSRPEAPLVPIASRGSGEGSAFPSQSLYRGVTLLTGPDGLPAGKVVTLVSLNGAGAPTQGACSDPPPMDALEHEVVTQDPVMERQLDLAARVASRDATVLIQGESGTGKELVARYIHRRSGRSREPYVAVNCAALPDTLAESELFGHERGAFTGAVKTRAGKFELAGRGTLVLDEISEMPWPLQAKLLRVIQERRIDPLGGQAPLEVNCRLVAISNRDLKSAVQKGKFRLDLYHRLNVIPLTIPALRQRPGDIALLADFFLTKFGRRYDRPRLGIPPATMAHLKAYAWPGNVRELENALERAVLIAPEEQLTVEDLILDDPLKGLSDPTAVRVGQTVREMERELIMKTLQTVSENRTRAAEMLGISIRTLRNKLNEYKAAASEGSPS